MNLAHTYTHTYTQTPWPSSVSLLVLACCALFFFVFVFFFVQFLFVFSCSTIPTPRTHLSSDGTSFHPLFFSHKVYNMGSWDTFLSVSSLSPFLKTCTHTCTHTHRYSNTMAADPSKRHPFIQFHLPSSHPSITSRSHISCL